MPIIDYKKDFLLEDLRDLNKAAEYLSVAVNEGEDIFLLAVRDVIEAQIVNSKGVSADSSLVDSAIHPDSQNFSKTNFSGMAKILENLGLKVKFLPKLEGDKAA